MNYEEAAHALDTIEEFERITNTSINLEHGWGSHRGPAMSRAVIVMGATRSGTSSVAGVLHHIGCRMRGRAIEGPANPRGTFEDEEFLGIQLQREDCRVLTQEFALRYASVIRRRNSQYPIWGVKEPRLAFILADLLPFFEDARFVFVARDVEAIKASYDRWEAEIAAPPIDEQISEITHCVELIEGKYARYGVHYEKLLADPGAEVGRLAQFVYDGLEIMPTDWALLRAVQSIDPEMRHY